MESTSAPARLRGLASWLLAQASTSAQRLVADGLGRAGAQRSHVSVLSALDEFGPASQAELCRRCGIDRSDMVHLLNALAGSGFVERSPDPHDRRRNVVTIAAAGRRRLRELDRILVELQEQILSPLSSAERRRFVASLGKIVDHHAGSRSPAGDLP